MNHPQPPQIFGAYSSGMAMGPDLSDLVFGDPATLLDDSNEAKRRRIARVGSSLVQFDKIQRD
jgi:hypothetical protein